MSDKQLAILLGQYLIRIDNIHDELNRRMLESGNFVKAATNMLGQEIKVIPVLDDLDKFIDQMKSDIEDLLEKG